MNDHNLDDLIIDSIEPNQSKTKGLLTIVALFIVFLIVGIIIAKIYTKESNSATLAFEENNSEMIAPELKLQAPEKVTKMNNDGASLSAIIEEEIGAPETEINEDVQIPTPEKPVITQEATEVVKETVDITEEYTQIPQQEKLSKSTVKEIETEPMEVPRPTTPKPAVVKKPIKTIVTPKEKPKMVSDSSYYIQVGSFSQDPSTRFLSVIKNSGFTYTITNTSTKGIKKLLIGPYTTKESADNALKEVRDRINKSAFVIKK